MLTTKPFSFAISDSPEIINSLYFVDEHAQKLLQETFRDVNRKKKSAEGKLYEYIKEYPELPQFKNRLASYYQLSGKREKAKEISLLTLQQHPDYLFGKITLALEYYFENNFDEMLPLLGSRLELDALYPEKKIFHVSEVMNYYKMVALYLNAVDSSAEAWDVIDRMEAACPGHPDIEEATKELFRYNAEHASRRMKEDEKTNKTVSGSFRQSIPASSAPPQFENKIIEELYKHDFRLPPEILKEILDLPEESLLSDLKKVLDDGIARYNYFKTDKNRPDELTNFLLHAIFIIAEKGRIDCLQNIFDVLKNGDEFTEFYFGDTKTELLWIAFYKLAVKDVSLLFAFLKERNIDTFSKIPVNQAVEQLYYHHENFRQPIIDEYRRLSAYFIAGKEDEALTDTNVIASAACTMRDIAVEELKEQIKELYEHNLVYYAYAGNYKSLMKHQRSEERKKEAIPSVFEMYEKVITTWAGYKDDEEGDDAGHGDDRDDIEAGIYADWTENRDENTPWYNEDTKPFVRTEPKIGRNDHCPCGSGKKYKKCCMKLPESA
jgi:uncharacterized protein YecA (UPF0149 family)